MSHFTVLVIGDDIKEQLAPYDENIEVEKYLVADVTENDIQQFKDYYLDKFPEKKEKDFEFLYSIHGEDWNGNRYQKDPDDVWREYSTYNPKSKWDWYQIGGRWSGSLKVIDPVTGDETTVDSAPKGKILNLDELVPFAVLKNGEWYERGKMGWWAVVSNEKEVDEWTKEVKELLADVHDSTQLTVVDCHI